MASQAPKLHLVLFPLMAQGHMIPMMDIAKILVQHNFIVTVVTTPQNASRFTSIFARYIESGFQLRLVQLPFPYKEAGFPEGCETLDTATTSLAKAVSFFKAISFLRQPVEKLFEELTPPPSCIISDMIMPYTIHIARKFNIPRISFVGVSCFLLLCYHNLRFYNVKESIKNEYEYFVMPGLPGDDKIEMNIAQIGLPEVEGWKKFNEEIAAAENDSYGMIMNSFEELEPLYAREYKKVRKDKLWCIGPLSLSNKDHLDKAQRGNKASIDENHCLKWLDLKKPSEVIYVCFGSMCNLIPLQFIELGMALEESKRPFIWVMREKNQSQELNKWFKESGFEERTKGHSLLIKGWAPQVLILSHPSIGGFITHCGWNSTLEAITASVPMLTWPIAGDQFFNEKFIVQILRVGVRVGVEIPVNWGEEEKIGVLVKKGDVKKALDALMDETNESEGRRKRVKELAKMAKNAVENGGSSHHSLTMFIQDMVEKSKRDI